MGILVFPFLGYSLLAVIVVPPDSLLLEELDEERDLPRRERLVLDPLRSRRRLVRTISLSWTCSGYSWKSSSPYRCGSEILISS